MRRFFLRYRHFCKLPFTSKIWLLRSKFIPLLPVPLPVSQGGWWLNRNDAVSRRVFFSQNFEEGERRFVSRFLQAGMTIFDIGAHHGLYTLISSKQVGLTGHVIAFEPSPRELRILRLNLYLNGRRNVRVEPLALGSKECLVELYVCLGSESGCNSLRPPVVSEAIAATTVSMVTLDKYLNEHSTTVDFIKMDVEGAELEVLRGAGQLFNSGFRPIILCELADVRTQPWGYQSNEIYDFLTSKDYRWYSITTEGGLRTCSRKDTFHESLVAVPVEKIINIMSLLEETRKYDTN